MDGIDNTLFFKNLLLTQFFCERRLLNCDKNAASIFRSINPVHHGKKLFNFKITDYGFAPETRYSFSTEWTHDPLRNENGFYNELFEFQLSQKRGKIGDNVSEQKFDGRILVAEIDNTVIDGASEVCSEGLIDVYDCPPIDTWFYLTNNSTERILFAWIPKQFVHNANEAIKVNCVDCLYWFEGQQPLVK
jgi:hypothetical protein